MVAKDRYIVHEHPVGRASQNYIAMVDLRPFGFTTDTMEQVWLVPVPDGKYQLACIPFRAYGLALDDTVILDPNGRLITDVVAKSGHRVFRIFLTQDLSDADLPQATKAIADATDACSMLYEWSGNRHIAIDVPADGDIGPIWNTIQDVISTGQARWEWGDVEDFQT